MRSAVLFSGGLDSAVLVAEEAAAHDAVQPVYVSTGLAWEDAERAVAARFVAHLSLVHRVHPLVPLTVDVRDIYTDAHWAVRGRPPAYHTPDEDVYLPGRNVTLLGKAGVFCAAAKVGRLALGTLAGNPFPDATPEFLDAMARALSLGLGWPLQLAAPYAKMRKAEVIRRGAAIGVPFELTLSCLNPASPTSRGRPHAPAPTLRDWPPLPTHCGICSKCRERHDAFAEAGVADPTVYDDERYVLA